MGRQGGRFLEFNLVRFGDGRLDLTRPGFPVFSLGLIMDQQVVVSAGPPSNALSIRNSASDRFEGEC